MTGPVGSERVPPGTFGLRQVAARHVRALVDRLGPDAVIVDPDRLATYARDETEALAFPPDVAVLPVSVEQVEAVMRLAFEERLPVVPRAAGTGLSGGALPVCGGIVLSVERLDRIREIDERNLVAVAESGVITAELQRAVEARGLFYPPDPSSRETCRLGGNLAEDAAGPRSLQIRHHAALGARCRGGPRRRPPARDRKQVPQGRDRLCARPAPGRIRGNARRGDRRDPEADRPAAGHAHPGPALRPARGRGRRGREGPRRRVRRRRLRAARGGRPGRRGAGRAAAGRPRRTRRDAPARARRRRARASARGRRRHRDPRPRAGRRRGAGRRRPGRRAPALAGPPAGGRGGQVDLRLQGGRHRGAARRARRSRPRRAARRGAPGPDRDLLRPRRRRQPARQPAARRARRRRSGSGDATRPRPSSSAPCSISAAGSAPSTASAGCSGATCRSRSPPPPSS